MKTLFVSLFVSLFAIAGLIPEAEARRLGGGGNFGMQRQMTPPPAPRQPAAAPPTRQAAPAGTQAPARSSWMGPVAGLAAGLGLAALFSHLGLGEELASFLLIALLVFGAVMLFRMLSRRAAGAQRAPAIQYAGGAQGAAAHSYRTPTASAPLTAADPAAATPHAGTLRDDFDAEAFERQAKVQFIRLQAANDEANLDDIRAFTTPEVFAELRMQIADRGPAAQRTDVIELDAQVLEVSEEAQRYVVSVRFHGLVREETDAAPIAFDEVWHLTKGKQDERGWVIAGFQQLS